MFLGKRLLGISAGPFWQINYVELISPAFLGTKYLELEWDHLSSAKRAINQIREFETGGGSLTASAFFCWIKTTWIWRRVIFAVTKGLRSVFLAIQSVGRKV